MVFGIASHIMQFCLSVKPSQKLVHRIPTPRVSNTFFTTVFRKRQRSSFVWKGIRRGALPAGRTLPLRKLSFMAINTRRCMHIESPPSICITSDAVPLLTRFGAISKSGLNMVGLITISLVTLMSRGQCQTCTCIAASCLACDACA